MHLFVVEDEPEIRQELCLLLRSALYQVTAPDEFEDVESKVLETKPDLVLLDLNLPGESGFQICKKIRAHSDVPIIFVTGRSDSMDELNGLWMGGDDYITKPFAGPILLAHIAAVLKRSAGGAQEATRLFCHDVELDLGRGCICFRGRAAELTRNELKILHCLFLEKEKMTSRTRLIDYLWDHEAYIDDNALSVHMTRIRGKLEQIGLQDFIKTKRGMGYYLCGHMDGRI